MSDFNDLEKAIDGHFRMISAFHEVSRQEAHEFLCVAEDCIRMQMWYLPEKISKIGREQALNNLRILVDRGKYALKHALSAIFGGRSSNGIVPSGAKAYERHSRFFYSLCEYHAIASPLSAVYGKSADCVLDAKSGNYVFVYKENHEPNTALALLQYIDDQGVSPFQDLLKVMHGINIDSHLVSDLSNLTWSSDQERISYKFDPQVAASMQISLDETHNITPASWQYPWSSCAEYRLFVRALSIRCLYHFSANHYGSNTHSIRGGSWTTGLLLQDKNRLRQEIAILSGLDDHIVDKIIQAITYGNHQKHSDPSLQPIIPVSSKRVVVSPIHYLSLSHDRNALALHARLDPLSFDACSAQFERGMLSESAKYFARFGKTHFNKTISAISHAGEIDLLVVSSESRSILVVEAKWTIPPGDPREVSNRREESTRKIKQLDKKVSALRASLAECLSALGIKDSCAWTIGGFVLISGYDGVTDSNRIEYPCISTRILYSVIDKFKDLHGLIQWSISRKWHPSKGKHYTMKEELFTVSGKTELLRGVVLTDEYHDYFRSHLPLSTKGY